MELSTIVGLVGGFVCIIGSVMLSGGNPVAFYDLPSILCTVGGSSCALMMNYTIKEVLALLKIIGLTFKPLKFDPESLIMKLQEMSEKARREGLLALEEVVEDIDDQFMKNGLKLVVDGTDQEVIKNLMENELSGMNDRHAKWCKMLDQWAKLAPGFGMLGTVMGLIGMLRNLEDKSKLGPNMAVALITTLYGALMANFLFTPWMGKLAGYDADETTMKIMVIEGVLSIQAGDNPRILTLKLLSFLEPAKRKALEEKLLKD